MADSSYFFPNPKKQRNKKTMDASDHSGPKPSLQSMADEPSDVEANTISTGSNSRKKRDGSNSTPSSTAISVPADIQQQIANLRDKVDPDQRQASLCCGSCCDLPRACIIVNSIYLVFMVLTLIAHFAGFSFFDRIRLFRGDGEQEESGLDLQQQSGGNMQDTNCFFCTATEQNICGIVFSILGILGSTTCMWNKCMTKFLVLLTGVWYVVDAILYLVFLNWPAAIFTAAYSYPHLALFWALYKGKITRENYHTTEKYCCFCLDATKQ